MGGHFSTIYSQLASWNGASTESEIPYCNSDKEYSFDGSDIIPSPYGDWTLPYDSIYQNAYHVQKAFSLLRNPYVDTDPTAFTNQVKEQMLIYGSAILEYIPYSEEPEYNSETASQYAPGYSNKLGHDTAIVGWDDNYSASNFSIEPPGNGAWIVKNSWGKDFGDQGYFYLSYYDYSIQTISFLDVETEETGFSYDKNYQYDYLGDKANCSNSATSMITTNLSPEIQYLPEDSIKCANVFTSDSNETLKAVGLTNATNHPTSGTVSIYLLNSNYTNPEDGELVATITQDNIPGIGFYTLELNEPIPLPAGTTYSVVATLNAHNFVFYDHEFNEVTRTIPTFTIEFGLENPTESSSLNQFSQQIGTRYTLYQALAQPGQSYVYGLNDDIGTSPAEWKDITDPSVQKNLKYAPEIVEENPNINNFVPGNVMIKAYTTYGLDDSYIAPTSVSISPETIYLTTDTENMTAATTAVAKLSPLNCDQNLEWSVNPSNIVDIIDNGISVSFIPKNTGRATLTVTTSNELVATANIIVANTKFVCDGIDVMKYTPDYMTVVIRNIVNNPAVINDNDLDSVSLFCWSEENQGDINAKRCFPIPGTNDWIYEHIPINETPVNNYFLNADDIYIHVYASGEKDSNGDLIGIANTGWIDPGIYMEAKLAYVTYSQNIGFNTPTVWTNEISGQINNPNSDHMEGFRISSAFQGYTVNSKAYVAGKGWIEAEDGEYCGSMHEDLPIEAINLDFLGDNETLNEYDIVYRIYLKNSGWTDWVRSGQTVGTPNSGNPVQAIQVNLDESLI